MSASSSPEDSPSCAQPEFFCSSVKLVLLGDPAIGAKTSLLLRLVSGQFYENSDATIGASFRVARCTMQEMFSKLSVEMWDTAGQERYRNLAPMYYRGAGIAFVGYDITKWGTFESAQHWVTELKGQPEQCPVIMLIGNKMDLEDKRVVPKQEGEAFAQTHSTNILFMETSAKTGFNVEAAFSSAVLVWLAKTTAEKKEQQPASKLQKKRWTPSFLSHDKQAVPAPVSPFVALKQRYMKRCITFLCSGLPRTGRNSPASELPPDVRQSILLMAFPEIRLLAILQHAPTTIDSAVAAELVKWQRTAST